MIDHVVAEVWDEPAGRWRLVDPEMDAAWTPTFQGRPLDWPDLSPEAFVTGPRAWQTVRAGLADPKAHVVAPELVVPATRGWTYLAHNVVHDLAALAEHEQLAIPPVVTSYSPAAEAPLHVDVRRALGL